MRLWYLHSRDVAEQSHSEPLLWRKGGMAVRRWQRTRQRASVQWLIHALPVVAVHANLDFLILIN